MTTLLGAIARVIGLGGVLFVLLLAYEEGIPGASRIPFLTSIPILGDLTAGHVHTYAADQVKLATADMVTRFERDTLAAQLAEEQRRRNAAAQALEEYRKRMAAAELVDQQQSEQREQEIMAYEIRLSQANRQCLLDGDDLEFLRHN